MGFGMVIAPIILACATCQYQYYCLMFYIFYAIIDVIFCLDPVAKSIQNTL